MKHVRISFERGLITLNQGLRGRRKICTHVAVEQIVKPNQLGGTETDLFNFLELEPSETLLSAGLFRSLIVSVAVVVVSRDGGVGLTGQDGCA